MVKKLIGKVLGTTEADACLACDSYYEYRCYNNMRQRRWVRWYGCYCQYKAVNRWVYVGCCGTPCPTP